MAALLVWVPARRPQSLTDPELPTVHLPLLAVTGGLFVMVGVLGWVWASPVQQLAIDRFTGMRMAVNGLLYAAGGVAVPLLYTWFVSGTNDPGMSARGLVAGVVAGLAVGPLGGPAAALVIGLLAGGSVPFVTFAMNRIFRLDDSAGVVATTGLPAAIGLLCVGIFADGAAGAGWQQIGAESYLGVTGQGVTGLLAARGFQSDFPGQIQAQVIGIAGLSLWGFFCASLLCAPLGLVFKGIERAMQDGEPVVEQPPVEERPRRERSRPWREAVPQAQRKSDRSRKRWLRRESRR